MTRFAIAAASLFALTALATNGAIAQPSESPPSFVQRGLPGPGHEVLKALTGNWVVHKSTFIAGGSADKPLRGTVNANCELIAGGRFLRDVSTGSLGGKPYFRIGLLGYSNEDQRYEWTTADALNANMMIYLGERGSGPAGHGQPILMTGTFTDQGLLGPQTAGQSIRQRTVFRIESPDRHVVELYFTPPGGQEILADRAIYTRKR